MISVKNGGKNYYILFCYNVLFAHGCIGFEIKKGDTRSPINELYGLNQ
jgi:hypothetical protein